MPGEHCFVCASDEGIFLDIFTDGKNYRDIIEACLSLKVQKRKIRSTKICHKCVFELDQCSRFVHRYKKTHQVEKGKLHKKRGCCCLCMEPGKKGYIFDLWDEDRLDNSIEKLHELFDVDFMMDNLCNLSICLDCRYNLDVLFDLRNLFKDTSRYIEDILNGDTTLSKLPKINTSVVKRKTTLTRMSKLSQSKSSLADSDASTVVIESPKRLRALSSRKLSPLERKCDECNVKIDNGMDMYRYHHSGNTVCKECWLTVDPCEKMKSKTRKVNNKTMKTKLCSVFLKDILTNSLETEKQVSNCKVEKGADGEIIYVISSDETDNENETKMLSTRLAKTKRKKVVVKTNPPKKLKTQHQKKTRLTRSNSAQSINVIEKKNTRQTRSESAETSDTEGKSLRKRSETIIKSVASKSPGEKKLKESTRPQRTAVSKKRKADESSSSSNEIITSSKVRRFSSSSYKIDSNDSKNESDSDNRPYTCKICSIDYENKVVGLTHELTHSKKLEVMLKKVALPEVTEDDRIVEREPSIEFGSPAPSPCKPSDTANELHPAITDESTLRELSDIGEDSFDDNNENPEVVTGSTYDEGKSEEENGKKKKKGKAKNKKNVTVKTKKGETEIEENLEEVLVRENDKEEKTLEENWVEKETEGVEDKTKETEEENSTNRPMQGDESVHKAADDIDEQSTKITIPNIHDKVPESNGKDPQEHMEIDENTIQENSKSDKEKECEIENEEDSSKSTKEYTAPGVLLENGDIVNEDEKDSAPPITIPENDNDKITVEDNKENNENATPQNESSNNGNKEVDESQELDEKRKDDGETMNEVREEKNEESSGETILNGNDKEPSDVRSAEHHDEGIDKSVETECTKVSDITGEYPVHNVTDTEKTDDHIALNEDNNVTPSLELESTEKDTNDDIGDDKNSRDESSEIENKLAEMMGESEVKNPKVTEEKKSDDMKSPAQLPSSESIAVENIGCE